MKEGETLQTVTRVLKKAKYLQALYQYGFYTLCYMIQEYEKEENYEECQIIMDAIRKHNEELNDNLPSKFDGNCSKIFKKAFKDAGFTGDIALGNVEVYAEKVKKMVNFKLAQPL